MATKKAITPAEVPDELGSPERIRLALSAVYEVEAIAEILRKLAVEGFIDPDDLFLRGTALRLRDLARTTMYALGDSTEDVRSIRFRLSGDKEDGATLDA